MIEVEALEYHAAHGCSLRCEQCSHYSDHRLRGRMPTPEDAERDFVRWTDRIRPRRFTVLGGEPTLNPHLVDLMKVVVRDWEGSRIMLVTNGLHLDRHPRLAPLLNHYGIDLDVSQHGEAPAYLEKFREGLQILAGWREQYPGIRITVRDSWKYWMRQYHQEPGGAPRPFTSDPAAAHAICMQRTCTQLYEGRLWKCPALAYFRKLEEKFPQGLGHEWEEFRRYEGLSSEASDDEVRAFFADTPIPQCSLCPAVRIPHPHPDPTALPVV